MPKKERTAIELDDLSLEQIVEKLNKKYGDNTLAIASKAVGLVVKFISTGIYNLDFCTGGGIPKNRLTEIRGNFSVLKSTVCNNIIANFQRQHPRGVVFYEDGEKSFDPAYAKLCGCDIDRVVVMNADCGEQAIDLMVDVMTIKLLDVLIVNDSIASLLPGSELDSSAEQQFQGLHPRLVGKMMRLVTGSMKRNLYDAEAPSVTMVCTNQMREKTGTVYGDPQTSPGGKAREHYPAVMIKFLSSPGDRIMEKYVKHGVERQVRIGQKVRFTVTKNKVSGSQFEEGEFNYFTRPYSGHAPYSFDNEEVLFRYGCYFGLIETYVEKKQTRYRYEDIDFASDSKFKLALISSTFVPQLYQAILQELVKESREGVVENPVERSATPKRLKLKFKTH